MERRFFDFSGIEMRQTDDQRTITGYAAIFNALSEEMWGFREKIAPGAFSETLSGDIRALWNHDTSIVLGRTRAGTLRVAEDDRGLRIEIDAPQSAHQQIEALERGDVDQMSFGFRATGEEWTNDDHGPIRTLTGIELLEVSPVTFPAYPATSVSVRNIDEVYGDIPQIPEDICQAAEPLKADGNGRALIDTRRKRLALLERG